MFKRWYLKKLMQTIVCSHSRVYSSTGCYCWECRKVISAIVLHLTLTSDYNFSSAPHYCGADVYSDFNKIKVQVKMSAYRLFSNRPWAEKFRQNSRKSIVNQSNGCLLHSYGQRKFNKINNYIKIQVKISARQLLFIWL